MVTIARMLSLCRRVLSVRFLSLHRYFCARTLSSRACSLYLSAGCPVFCIGVHFTLALCIDVSAHLIPVPRCWQCPLCLCIDVYVLVSSQGTLCPRCIDVCISSQGTLCPRCIDVCILSQWSLCPHGGVRRIVLSPQAEWCMTLWCSK